MTTTDREVRTLEDIDEDLAERIADHGEAWLGPKGQRDYEDWLSRLERDEDLDLPTQMDDPAIRKICQIGRAAWDEANAE